MGDQWWAQREEFVHVPDEQPSELALRIHAEGLLYAINRLALHDHGLALGMGGKVTEPGSHTLGEVSTLWLYASDDPEGIEYAEDGQHERGLERLRAAGHRNLADALTIARRLETGSLMAEVGAGGRALEVCRWLASMDAETGTEEGLAARQRVTLTEIIDRAKAALGDGS